jgi:hypothetical protein
MDVNLCYFVQNFPVLYHILSKGEPVLLIINLAVYYEKSDLTQSAGYDIGTVMYRSSINAPLDPPQQ